MAAIAFNDLFNRLGKIGHIGYVLAVGQAQIPPTIATLISYYELTDDLDLVGNLLLNQNQIIVPVMTPITSITGLASTTLVRMVNDSVPSISDVPSALMELIRQMKALGESVQAGVLSATISALLTNTGNGVLVITTKRGDGLSQANIVPETVRVSCTNDSYTGGAVAGQEQFSLVGQPLITPLWNYNYPSGSSANQTSSAISTTQTGAGNNNVLTNSSFDVWTNPTSTGQLLNWVLEVGTWGTDVAQQTTAFGGLRSVQFFPTAANTVLYQQFSTGAGTSSTLSSLTSYSWNFWIRAFTATITSGVLVVELVDGSGVVTVDAQSVPNSYTINLTGMTTAWTPVNATFRTPDAIPSVLRIRFRMATPVVGSSIYVDSMAMSTVRASYQGGFGYTVFSGSIPFRAGDAFNAVLANDYGGSLYLGTFQALFNRFYGMSSLNLLLPSNVTPTQPDTKITV